MKHYRQAYNTRELNDLYQLQTQVWNTHDPEFVKLNPYFHGRPGFGNRMTWPAWGNGGRLALVMLQTSEQLGLIPSANDYFQICEVNLLSLTQRMKFKSGGCHTHRNLYVKTVFYNNYA